jgi:hypothetical protein
MAASVLMLLAAAIVGALGTLHLVYTFVGPKLRPRDPGLVDAMQQALPGITRDTSLWDMWIGFNISHSLCAIQFALVFGYLALAQPALLFGSVALQAIAVLLLAALFATGLRYWFVVPTSGIALALGCALAAIVVARAA